METSDNSQEFNLEKRRKFMQEVLDTPAMDTASFGKQEETAAKLGQETEVQRLSLALNGAKGLETIRYMIKLGKQVDESAYEDKKSEIVQYIKDAGQKNIRQHLSETKFTDLENKFRTHGISLMTPDALFTDEDQS